MLKKLRELDNDTVIADGPKFDLPKVIEVAFAILRTLYQRAMMRFPNSEPPTYAFAFEDGEHPFGDESYAAIDYIYDDCKITRFDAVPLCCSVYFGPFMIDLYLLGHDSLNGPMINCLTDYDLNWDELDPTPVLYVMMRDGMTDPFDEPQYNFLRQVLEGFLPRGITWDAYQPNDRDQAVQVRFPHETFGKGVGPIKISRYLHEVDRDGEEEEE
ncbi:MAG: hypothetical protein WC866_04710 [Patescibacteria group bacterium]|jgi:hypothetical protein